MYQIGLTDRVFAKLQSLAIPLVDTTESVIERLADEKIAMQSQSIIQRGDETTPQSGIVEVQTDDLTHTFLKEASFNGIKPISMNWKKLIELAHIQAFKKLQSYDDLKSLTRSNIGRGKIQGRGYHYVEEIDISIQGVAVKEAWKNTLNLARKLEVPVYAVFEWRDHPESAHAGQTGRVAWEPK